MAATIKPSLRPLTCNVIVSGDKRTVTLQGGGNQWMSTNGAGDQIYSIGPGMMIMQANFRPSIIASMTSGSVLVLNADWEGTTGSSVAVVIYRVGQVDEMIMASLLEQALTKGGASSPFTEVALTDSDSSHPLLLTCTGNNTANRNLNFNPLDASRTLTLGGNITTAANVTFAGAFSYTATLNGITSVTFPTTGTLATLGGAETLTNKTLGATAVTGNITIAADILPTTNNTRSLGSTGLRWANIWGTLATITTRLDMGSIVAQGTPLINARVAGAGIEFGHSNAAGYHSFIGSDVANGNPVIGFSCLPGTTSNTYKTGTSLLGSVLRGISGGFVFQSVPLTNTDNQAPVTMFTIGPTRVVTSVPLGFPVYTVGTVPLASLGASSTIYVSNESGGAVLAFSDGTNWRRVTDRAVIS